MFNFLSLLPMFQSAISTVASFTGNALEAKTTGYIQDAVHIVTAFTPLVQQFAGGTEVTEEDVRNALAGKDAALAELDAEIAKHA